MSKVKLKINVTYDAGKLAKKMPEIISKFVENYTIRTAENAKDEIKDGKLKQLGEVTKKIRDIRGHTPHTPLVATGTLLNSIKVKKLKTMSKILMKNYGLLHNNGFKTAPNSMIPNSDVPARPFLKPSKKFAGYIVRDFRNAIKKAFAKK